MASRPATLGASLAPVLVGLALASRSVRLDATIALVTAACALLLQIATNLANDYFDHRHGVDTGERLGPVRVTQAGLLTPAQVRTGLLLVLSAAAAAGFYLILEGGPPILLIGVAAMLAAVAYSAGPYPLAWHGLGEALVFAFFGFAAVGGTHHLQGAAFDWTVALAAYPLGALAAAIIVVNNLRDIDTDARAGKRTLAVRMGDRRTRIEYTGLVVSALLSLFVLAVAVTPAVLLGLLATPSAAREIAYVRRRRGAQLNRSLVGTARLHALVGALLAAGLCI
jgi:1,4-dihydroxy-2-naphthoate octaprenyltransferase